MYTCDLWRPNPPTLARPANSSLSPLGQDGRGDASAGFVVIVGGGGVGGCWGGDPPWWGGESGGVERYLGPRPSVTLAKGEAL